MPNEVKLLPEYAFDLSASQLFIMRGKDRDLLRINLADGTVEGEIEDAGEAAKVFVEYLRSMITRPTIATDEVVELIRDELFDASTSPPRAKGVRYFEAWQTGYDAALNRVLERAIAAMPAIVGGEGQRVCSVCTAVISQYPEGMCCHCQEMPWPLAQPDTPHD